MNLSPDELARMMRHAQADAHRNSAVMVRSQSGLLMFQDPVNVINDIAAMHEVAAKRLEEM